MTASRYQCTNWPILIIRKTANNRPIPIEGVCVCVVFSDVVEPPDVLFNPQGYLLLSSKDDAELMETDHQTQTYDLNMFFNFSSFMLVQVLILVLDLSLV